MCDDNLVRLASQGDLLAKSPSYDFKNWSQIAPGRVGDMDVLDWASLAGRCNLTKFCGVCEHYICKNFNAVRTDWETQDPHFTEGHAFHVKWSL